MMERIKDWSIIKMCLRMIQHAITFGSSFCAFLFIANFFSFSSFMHKLLAGQINSGIVEVENWVS